MNDVHEVLVRGRNRIEREGWAQGSWNYASRTGPDCAFGVCYGPEVPDAATAGAQAALQEALGAEAVPDWNDAPERTKEEVLALFDRAIAATAPEPDTEFLNRASFREPANA